MLLFICDRNHRRSFKGLYLDQIGFVYSTQSWIASGEPRSMTVVGSATQSKKVMPLSFGLIINTRFNTTYTDDEWIEIIDKYNRANFSKVNV